MRTTRFTIPAENAPGLTFRNPGSLSLEASVNEVGLIHRLVQVRSQYAVILALAGLHRQARAEIQRLTPYIDGLTDEQCFEVASQANYIEHLDQQANRARTVKIFGNVGRNETCPCGSGRKYKKCHGA
ncbi:hypothetical protein C6H65_16165 [Photorhabdus luminescens]|nr:hypothetical protein C6H65_16165 [Photorhabdus luminescens]